MLPVLCCKLHVSEVESVMMCYNAMPYSGVQFYNVWRCRSAAYFGTQLHLAHCHTAFPWKRKLLSLSLFLGCICLHLTPVASQYPQSLIHPYCPFSILIYWIITKVTLWSVLKRRFLLLDLVIKSLADINITERARSYNTVPECSLYRQTELWNCCCCCSASVLLMLCLLCRCGVKLYSHASSSIRLC